MGKQKKPNPRKKPASEADVKQAERRGREQGAHLMFACILVSIKDLHFIDNDELASMWQHANMLLEENQLCIYATCFANIKEANA